MPTESTPIDAPSEELVETDLTPSRKERFVAFAGRHKTKLIAAAAFVAGGATVAFLNREDEDDLTDLFAEDDDEDDDEDN